MNPVHKELLIQPKVSREAFSCYSRRDVIEMCQIQDMPGQFLIGFGVQRCARKGSEYVHLEMRKRYERRTYLFRDKMLTYNAILIRITVLGQMQIAMCVCVSRLLTQRLGGLGLAPWCIMTADALCSLIKS